MKKIQRGNIQLYNESKHFRFNQTQEKAKTTVQRINKKGEVCEKDHYQDQKTQLAFLLLRVTNEKSQTICILT